jgi:transcriptional regulator with GAF, ATPase, and Fis domain
VTTSTRSEGDLPVEASIPGSVVPLESVVRTEDLRRRPCRRPEYEKENAALLVLSSALADSPHTILQTLADKVLEILGADSAGLSLLTRDEKRFYWAAIAGAWHPHIGGGTPRDFGPCGDVLDRSRPMLFSHWERRYPYLVSAIPLAEEGLLAPFFVNGRAVGTIWAIAHTNQRRFDAEDLRLLESLGRFASAAYQAVASIDDLKFQVAEREKAEAALHVLTNGLEIQVRRRTEALDLRNEEVKKLRDQLFKENVALRDAIDEASMFEEIVGASDALRRVLATVARVAPTDSTVLITGETGTGKELVARAIHKRSPRSARAFISVNCAAIPRELIASELFGHEKGAFTGATNRRLGRFESADGGTIFLDEVGDLSMETQVALLRVLQEREFERVGGVHPIPVDVRVLAATNRNLKAAIAAGTFREDLFYRLSVFPIGVPSLRQRLDDIPLLVEYLIERYAKKTGKTIRHVSKDTLALFQTYDWPGNVRELQNVVERAVILCDSDVFAVDESWLVVEPTRQSGASGPLVAAAANLERDMIESALAQSGGRVGGPAGAAARLGVPRQTLESKIAALHIDKHQFRSAPR